MTVGELKVALANVPDDAAILDEFDPDMSCSGVHVDTDSVTITFDLYGGAMPSREEPTS